MYVFTMIYHVYKWIYIYRYNLVSITNNALCARLRLTNSPFQVLPFRSTAYFTGKPEAKMSMVQKSLQANWYPPGI